MPAYKANKKPSIFDLITSLPVDNSSAESSWKHALLLKELLRDDHSGARQRRAEAMAARAQAEHEAISSTKQVCSELQTQARVKYQEAEDALNDARRMRTNAELESHRMVETAHAKLESAEVKKREAERYSEQIQSNARAAADSLLAQARVGSQEVANRMRHEAADEIRKALTDIDSARSAAEEELETQRILSETARIRSFTNGISSDHASDEDEQKGHKVVDFVPFGGLKGAPSGSKAKIYSPLGKRGRGGRRGRRVA